MCVDGNGFPPAQAHETHAIRHLWADALQLQDRFVSLAVSFSSSLRYVTGRGFGVAGSLNFRVP